MRSVKTAYWLWAISFLGVAGIHRLYMGKIPTGILWICTWGLFGIGTMYDAATMSRQIREKDEADGFVASDRDYWREPALSPPPTAYYPAESLEHIALRLAQQNGGFTTPAQLALQANVGADQAKAQLDDLCAKGMADIRIRHNGVVAYVFLDFLQPEIESEFTS